MQDMSDRAWTSTFYHLLGINNHHRKKKGNEQNYLCGGVNTFI